MDTENRKWILLTIIGGIFIIVGGVTGNIGFFTFVYDILLTIPELAPLAPLLSILIFILGFFASLGGFAVILGALLVLNEKYRTGTYVIGLGTGMGLIGLLIYVFTGMVSGTLATELLFILCGKKTHSSLAWVG